MKTVHNLSIFILGFCLVVFAKAQAGVTLLVKTDMSCNWKIDGQPIAQLGDDGSAVVLVSKGQHIVEASTVDGLTTSLTKVEVGSVEVTVDLHLKSRHDSQVKMQLADAAKKAVGSKSAMTWTDLSTGLTWSSKDNGSDVGWPQATAYCSAIQLGGFNDWRLPTFDELQAVYEPSISLRKKFDNGVTYDVHIKGNLALTGWTWSSTLRDVPDGSAKEILFLNFGNDSDLEGTMGLSFQEFSYSMRALCVRRASK